MRCQAAFYHCDDRRRMTYRTLVSVHADALLWDMRAIFYRRGARSIGVCNQIQNNQLNHHWRRDSNKAITSIAIELVIVDVVIIIVVGSRVVQMLCNYVK